MLDELCEQYNYDRKHAIKLLGDCLPPSRGSAPPGPLPRYQVIRDVLDTIWEHGRTSLRQTTGPGAGTVAAALRQTLQSVAALPEETPPGDQSGHH
jgi:hypothetical protein